MTIREVCDIATKKLREFNTDPNLKVEVCYRSVGYCYSVHVNKFDKESWITIDSKNDAQEQIDLIVEKGKELIESFSKEVASADEMFAGLGFNKLLNEFKPLYVEYVGYNIRIEFWLESKKYYTHSKKSTCEIDMALHKAINQKIKELGW